MSRASMTVVIALASFSITAGCRQDMHDQPRYKPLAPSTFFSDGRSARPGLEDTVARGQLRIDSARYQGRTAGGYVAEFPIRVSRADLERGRERYDIFCAPCHGMLGDGRGMIVQRGLRQPPTYHSDRLRAMPVGYYFEVITNGYGAMYSYASRVPPDDRWRITAYIRALQLSAHATEADVPAGQSVAALPANANATKQAARGTE